MASRVLIIIEGGSIMKVLTDGAAEVMVVEYDTEMTDPELHRDVPQQGDDSTRGAVYRPYWEDDAVEVNRLMDHFKDVE